MAGTSIAGRVIVALALVGLGACAGGRAIPSSLAPIAGTSAVRVVHSASGRTIPFSELVAAAARADLVFVGEQHDDPETHFAEFALLEGIGRTHRNVVVSLEMFERDVQTRLDAYLAGRLPEAEFLKDARPWDRYATDYRALVQLARTRGWPVVASNVPRPIASAVSRRGLIALDSLPAASRAHAARESQCPHDSYFARFADQMTRHGPTGPSAAPDTASMRAMTQRFYEAQCLKDETMAESIAAAYTRAGDGAVVIHYNGAFHSDHAEGTAARAMRRLPGARTVVITMVPVADPQSAPVADYTSRADYVVFTRRPAPR